MAPRRRRPVIGHDPHRIDQQRPVILYRLVAKDTIEERILKLHANKRDLADALLAGTDDSSRHINTGMS